MTARGMTARKLPDHLSPVWEPIFNRPLALEAVAEDAREPFAQMASYGALLANAPLNEAERSEVMQAMQLCERTHGYAAVADALHYAARALSAGVLLVGMPATALARRYDCANAGVLAGALIEEWAAEGGLLKQKRRFPELPWWTRHGSPHPLLDDCRVGARVAWLIDRHDEEGALAYSALLAAARIAHGEKRAGELAERLISAGGTQGALSEAAKSGLDLPPVWQRYAYRRSKSK